ncbi:MAG: mercuric reductase [Elusimicrobia bacterium CG_4_9_14_3_um_filter_62_55]|nr:MAG: mercuric reductase [Elusimicrobia bacterium CG22_combo_CG10-13_8_21_14_all_63_91]PJA13693.1 MAG: mercuric reductase [Elusimicrobia bacterium CG_4_10_14_0_2_um_filter_63_34]PJB23186.1 MAG: mercuric reductase [Elusimicrobia bacterium CG_4_9_14_3_um_filter_62_55]
MSPETLEGSEPLLLPDDKHNRKTVSNVHPSDWMNPEPSGTYHLVVLGAGTAGLISAIGSAGLGAKVALVEKHLMGGDCLNVGCVPSKGLLRAARAYAEVRDADGFGVRVPDGTRVDFPAVMERMRRLRARISDNDGARRYRDAGVDVFLGHGKFTGPDSLVVDGKTLRFKKAVIATGARAAAPPIPGLAEAGYLTNETVFSLTELPKRLAIIGAGPIGCELAQAFARFGSQVHLIESADHILIREDPDAAAVVEKSLIRDGVDLVCCGALRSVSKRGADKVLSLEAHGDKRELVVDEILVGVGRAPNVESIGLEAAGVAFDPRVGITVDETLRTANPAIFAAGDVCFPYKFTHTAEALAKIVIQNALFAPLPFLCKKTSALTIPWTTYTDPEIAHVGMYEKDARDRGIAVKTIVEPLKDVDRAILDGEDDGFVKIHYEDGTDRILGATLVAKHAGEMISELTLAMTAGVGLGTLADTIHPYPTQAEAIKRAAGQWKRTKLTPFVKSLFKWWLGD